MSIQTVDTVLAPVASVEDARETANALGEQFDPGETAVTLVFVVEKAGGAPDKAGVEQRAEIADAAFDAAREALSEFEVETKVVYDDDVADGIFEAASEIDADAIAFVARDGGRLTRFLSGDVALSLVTENDRPVVSLPALEEER